jgi:hypothetical protein
MAKVVLALVTLVFQRVARLVFDAPPCPTTPHQLIPRALIDAQVGDPADVLARVAVRVPLPALQAVDQQVRIGVVERHITDNPQALAETRGLVMAIVLGHLASSLGGGHLLEQGGLVTFFTPPNLM